MNNKKKSKKQRVLIGMNGSMDSSLAAYLLKKQGYDCVGIGIIFCKDGPFSKLFSGYQVEDVDKIQEICDELEIDFYAVNATDIFQDKILDPLVAKRLVGTHFNIELHVTALLVDILLQKLEPLKADLIATSHYAKIQKSQITEEYSIMASNDIENDQSFVLGMLKQKHLKKLILPFSETRVQEVKKIAELMTFDFVDYKSNINSLYFSQELTNLVIQNTPEDLRPEGTMYSYIEETNVTDHLTTAHYYLGQKKLSGKDDFKVPDQELQVIKIQPQTGNVYVTPASNIITTHCLLSHVYTSKKFDLTAPMKCFLRFEKKEKMFPVKVYFKNNNYLTVQFNDVISEMIPAGKLAVLYDKEGMGGKVLFFGEVKKSGIMRDNIITHMPLKDSEREEEDEEGGNKKKKHVEFKT